MDPELFKKKIRHTFNADERAALSQDLLSALSERTNAEAEFESEKSKHKAKIAAAEARIEHVASTLRSGWEMRDAQLACELVPEKRQKFYYKPDDAAKTPLLWEDMTEADFQLDLLRAEAKFQNRAELVLWDTAPDRGIIVIGSQDNRWFTACRLSVGGNTLDERLDSEQTSTKDRFIALQRCQARVMKWLKEKLGADTANGFEKPIEIVIENEREKAE